MQEKLQKIINTEVESADKYGQSKLSACNMLGYGWDRDVWNYRNVIIKGIMNRGYNVDVSVNWGVTDIITTQKISIKGDK